MAQQLNPNYLFLHQKWAEYKFFMLQGGGRSGKTYSIFEFIIWMFYQYPNAKIEFDCVRDSLPVLKATVVKELVDYLTELKLYDVNKHNMSSQRIEINGNYFNYYSVDTEIKARGRKRHILWLNEPNNMKKSIIDALVMRTEVKVICDYNPSEPIGEPHWIYDDMGARPNACKIVTTFKDNPKLKATIAEEIARYENADPAYFQVFGTGQRTAARVGQIYTHFQKCDELPSGRPFYGLDFGKTNDPSALVKCVQSDGAVYVDELIYQTNLTASEIVKLMKQADVNRLDPIYADSAEPLMIREIKDAGFNIMPCVKGAGSVSGGIDKVKSLPIFVTSNSTNLLRESNWYVWKLDGNGKPTNEPVDLHNHGMDATRYSIQHITDFKKRGRTMGAGAIGQRIN